PDRPPESPIDRGGHSARRDAAWRDDAARHPSPDLRHRPRRVGGEAGMTGRARLAGPLVEPQFRLLWIGQTASAAGDALIFVAVAFAVLQVGGSAADLGIVFAAFTISN